MAQLKYFQVDLSGEGERVDTFLSQQPDMPTRSQIQKLIENQKIKVNGVTTKANHKLHLKDNVSVEIPAPTESILEPQDIPLNILFEDEDIIVIYKPYGIVVHPGSGNPDKTLVNALLYHCKDLSGIGGVERPGVVHRLDKDTSGVIVFAKNDTAHFNLSQQFQDRSIQRFYFALVYGRMEKKQGMFDSPIGRHPSQRKKMSSRSSRGKPALTFYDVQKEFEQISLVKVNLKTGRTHQIRVHFSEAGHPVVGDETYGGKKRVKNIVNMEVRTQIEKLPALCLHAAHLTFEHPRTKEKMTFEAPLPEHFQNMLHCLERE